MYSPLQMAADFPENYEKLGGDDGSRYTARGGFYI
jgi:hypothetical protein